MSSTPTHPSKFREMLEALRRAPTYQTDFTKWIQLKENLRRDPKILASRAQVALKTCELLMQQKWKVRPPFPPPPDIATLNEWLDVDSTPETVPYRGWNPFIDLKVNILRPGHVNQSLIEQAFEGYDPIRLNYDYESSRKGETKVTWIGGRNLCLSIDLTATETELLEEIEQCVKHYQSLRPKRKTRQTPTREIRDIWWIYDERKRGKSIAEITQILLPKKKADSSVVQHYRATYNAVSRAQQKAESIIASLENTH